jgi:predicted alpha-1,2-mannosidase
MTWNEFTRRKFLQGLALTGAGCAIELPYAQSTVFAAEDAQSDLLDSVDPFIGTGGHGHTHPGATAPFGMIQLSPDTRNTGWDGCSGYHYTDGSIQGFSHTHLSGTGAGDLLDFLIMPRIGPVHLESGTPDSVGNSYRSRFSHHTEKASPGYYSVLLEDTGIRAELTATERAGLHRYSFPASAERHFVLDLSHAYEESPDGVKWATIEQASPTTILLGRSTDIWAPGRQIYAAIEFSQPFTKVEFLIDGKTVDAAQGKAKGKTVKAVAYFPAGGEEKILVRAGISGVDPQGALKNAEAEIPGWDFDGVYNKTAESWRSQLKKIRIETNDAKAKKIFYTALYHSMLGPILFDDVDGRYRGLDGAVHSLPAGQHNYTTFSLWDTYRAEHPLFTLIHGDRVPDMVNSLIRMAEQSPAGMPVWPLYNGETGCMTGYHSAAVMAEAICKGFPGIDADRAFAQMMKRAMHQDYRGLGLYRKYHYIPADLESESVSKTFEYCYDDWAIAHVAMKLNRKPEALLLRDRSTYYRNHFDKSTGFMRPKFSDGKWVGSSEGKDVGPFNPIDIGHFEQWRDYTESNGWQTTFAVQHDVAGLINLFGGPAPFVAKLDGLFAAPSTLPANAPPDIAGMVGQYAHGNEPSHHIAYLYVYAGQPWKTQARVRSLMETMYSAQPDGMAGNEDVGQTSAWFILSSLGFYSVDPVSGNYILGTPLFERATIELGNGRRLAIRARRTDPGDMYIQRFSVNNRPVNRAWFHHSEVEQGGELVVELSSAPNREFGADAKSIPPSMKLGVGSAGNTV